MFNKVIYKGTEILNVSNDTVVAEVLHAGYTAHDSNGVPITGVARTYEEGHLEGYASGYEEGLKANQSTGGGASDPAAEAVMKFLELSNVTELIRRDEPLPPDGVFAIANYPEYRTSYAIIPKCVTMIKESAIGYMQDPSNGGTKVLCLPIVPPTMEWQGWWSADGANNPPKVIYVPDESVDAYKAAENWSEFASLIKPMSELTCSEGEETEITFIVNDDVFTTKQGVTWREYIMSDSSGYFSINDDNYVCMAEMPIHWSGNSSMFVEANEIILPETDGVYHL